MLILLFFGLLPFIQLGASYYASVGTILAVVTLMQFAKPLSAGFLSKWHLALLALFMVPSLMTGDSADFTQDVLRVAREALVLVLMNALISGALVRPAALRLDRIMRLTLILLVGLAAITVVQYFALARGQYLGFPQAWYAQGTGTIASELSLRYSHLRPSATFSEPSYLSFITLSLLFMMSPGLDMRRRLGALLVLALVIGALSQAASFVLFAVLIGAVYVYDRASAQQRMILVPAAIVGAVVLLFFGSNIGPIARVLQGGSVSGDASIFVRIFGPAQILPAFLMEHPAGAPFSALLDILLPYTNPLGLPVEEFLHNSVFDLLFEYGFFGFFLLFAIFRVPDNTVRAYLLSCMLFNGAFLSLDKLAMVGFAISVYGAMKQRSALRDAFLAARRRARFEKAQADAGMAQFAPEPRPHAI